MVALSHNEPLLHSERRTEMSLLRRSGRSSSSIGLGTI